MLRIAQSRTLQTAAKRSFATAAKPRNAGDFVPITTLRGNVENRPRAEVEKLMGEANNANVLLSEQPTDEYVQSLSSDFAAAAQRAEQDVMDAVRANPLLKGSMEFETIGSAPLRLGRDEMIRAYSGTQEQLEKDLSSTRVNHPGARALEVSADLKLAEFIPKAAPTSGDASLGLSEEAIDALVDFHHPPRLSYEHVKLLKNIDYSTLVSAGRDGAGMFTVSDILPLIKGINGEATERVTDVGADVRQPHLFSAADTFDTMHGKLNKCRFCRTDPTEDRVQTIHYSNVDLIRQYINARGMILPSRVTGLCARHQRRIRYAIKNARFLALLSYTSDWHVPYSYVNPAQYPAHKDQQLARDHDVAERIERKQADLELLASARSTEDRQQITEAILARKGIVPGVDLSKEQRLVHLQALPNKLSGPFVDRFAPPNARAPVPDSEMATIGEILAAHPNAAMQHAAALLEEEADEAAELAAAPGFWSSEAELDAAGDSVFHAIANAGESAGYASEGELEYLREAAATEQDEARAAGFREFLTAQLQVRLAQTLNAEEAAEIREELRQLGCTDADAIRDGLGTVPRVRSNEDELAGRATGAGAVLRASAAPTAEQVLRDLGVDVGALAARDEGFDAVAWVEKIRQIQAANKLRNTQNPFDEGDRVEDLKALHRLGFTGTAEKQ